MISRSKSLFCSAFCASALFVAAAPASAAQFGNLLKPSMASAESSNSLQSVQYRPQYDGRRYNRYSGNRSRGNDGRNLALGIGGLIIGGIVLSEAARADHRRSHGSDWDRCAQTYRSFEPDTGMYTGYDGQRHTCPYLR